MPTTIYGQPPTIEAMVTQFVAWLGTCVTRVGQQINCGLWMASTKREGRHRKGVPKEKGSSIYGYFLYVGVLYFRYQL
jgi:hypothetical protein